MNETEGGGGAAAVEGAGPGGDPFARRVEAIARHVSGPYVQFLRRLGLDLEFVRAEGACVWDRAGRRFVDCVAGYGNLNLGHNHPRVIEAVVEELRSPRPFNLPFLSGAQARLSEMLAQVTPGDLECSFIVNSGSEAVDSALKLARLATGRPEIVSTRGAWHGFTFGAMSVSERPMVRSFEPLVPGITAVPYGDAAAVEAALTDQTAAVIVEPLQSENGAVVPPDGYLRALVDLCARRSVVLIFDEVKSGIGKTGRMWACDHEGAVPDVLLSGKALGGGAMPIGAMTARRRLWGRFGLSFPMSSSSGAGNAPACAAAVATLEVMEREGLAGKAARSGARILEAIAALQAEYPSVVRGVSGRGLLLALHTDGFKTAADLVSGCIRRGVLVMAAFCDRSRVLIEPPLAIADAEVDAVLLALREAVEEMAARTP
jgi:putrescine aminotransferase